MNIFDNVNESVSTIGPELSSSAMGPPGARGPAGPRSPPVFILAQSYTTWKVGQALYLYYRPTISAIGFGGNILALVVALQKHNRKFTG